MSYRRQILGDRNCAIVEIYSWNVDSVGSKGLGKMARENIFRNFGNIEAGGCAVVKTELICLHKFVNINYTSVKN